MESVEKERKGDGMRSLRREKSGKGRATKAEWAREERAWNTLYSLDQAGLQLKDPPFCPQSAGILGVYHHHWAMYLFLKKCRINT